MNLQTELDALAQRIASFHEPESVDDDQWKNFEKVVVLVRYSKAVMQIRAPLSCQTATR